MSSDSKELVLGSQQAIQKGSKSFALAGFFFDRQMRADVFHLYRWCRYCDDQIDEVGGDSQRALANLQHLREQTRQAMESPEQVQQAEFKVFAEIFHKYKMPAHYPLELLNGMEMDVRGQRYENFDQLKLYCYRVASVVGLMMSHIMGVSDEKALRHASDLGLAMQLTNIARDVRSDFENGRVYLPLSWLQQQQIEAEDLMNPRHRQNLVVVVERLLAEADQLYRSGDQGLVYLQRRCALVICMARNIYAEIGALVRRRGERAWTKRCYTGRISKGRLVLKSLWQSLWRRRPQRFQPVPLQMVWTHR